MTQFDSGDLFLGLCGLAATGVCVWSLRRSNLTARGFEDEIAGKVDRNELSGAEAFDLVVKRGSAIASSKARKTWLFFILTIAALTPFMARFH
jgi:hypothetical protein